MSKFKPIGKRILIEIEKNVPVKGILILPGKQKQTTGKVICIGDVEGISVGDTVLFTEYTGCVVPGDDDMLILDEEDVLAILI